MNNIKIVANTSFLGHTGYNSHSQNFFTSLNKYIPVRVRNYSYTNNLSEVPKEYLDMIIESSWATPPFKIGTPFNPSPNDLLVNIVLNESHHYYFYEKYSHPMIAYNVWESTKQLPQFFKRILEYDQFWCPTEWQRKCTIEQGYPESRIKVVPEGVDGHTFYPATNPVSVEMRKQLYRKYNIPENNFSFMIFGRWDYRKSVTEMIRAFNEEFKRDDNVVLILSADNPFPVDKLKTTEERLKHYNLENPKIKVLHFPPKEEYIQWLKSGHVFLSCSRAEGWNLPLIEAISCGIPSICSDWGAQLEFADGISYKVNVPNEKAPQQVFLLGDNNDLGVWGEPDFDHLKQVMRNVYNEYSSARSRAVKLSDNVRDRFTWDNAAKIAEKNVKELVKGYKQVPLTTSMQISFKTDFTSLPNETKVTFSPLINYDGELIICLKDTKTNLIKHSSTFDKLNKSNSYWISCYTQLEEVTFEVKNKNGQIVYSENKSLINNDCGIELYQDQIVNGSVVVKGKRDCESRYNSMKKVFDQYKRKFTILDIGANVGYYSIRATSDYDAVSIMVENKKNEVKVLLDLCDKNDCRDNLIVLNNTLTLHKLKELSKCEHFDVVLALNVLHHFENKDILEACEVFTKLGDNLILETPPSDDEGSCGKENLEIINNFFSNMSGEKLGDFKRHTSDKNSSIFWFKTPKTEIKWPYFDYEKLFTNKKLDVETLKNRGSNLIESTFEIKNISSPRREGSREFIPGINLKTFIKLNGVYPNIKNIVNRILTRNICGNYKWDNSNNDLVTHNFILNGHELHIIDYDDKLIVENTLTDNEQIQNVLREISEYFDISFFEKKIKLNLGCGNDIKRGYINIDRYNNTKNVDMNADLGSLPFKNNSVDELYTSHVFEHIGINDIYPVLEEWRRVLKLNAKLILRLPNLEKEVKIWLEASDDKKWFEVIRIFGSQSHPGNTHLCGFNMGSLKSFLERFNFEVEDIKLGNSGHGEEIQCVARKREEEILDRASIINHFVDGPYVEIKGDSKDKGIFQIDFLDPDNNSSVHQQILGINSWTRPYRKYFTNWLIQVRRNGKLIYEHNFDCKGKNVLISLDSKSMGDNLAWFPFVEEFRKKYNCTVFVSTFWNNFFEGHKTYKNLVFVRPGSRVNNLYASFNIGCFDENLNKNKFNWKSVPLQKVASDTLGLDYKEIVPDIAIKPGERDIAEKYVTISEHSTLGCKYWLRGNGWQTIVDYLNMIGYKVVVVSKEPTKLKNVIDRINRPIEHTINTIYHSEFFIGVSAGPSWLAWALRKPVILISGFSLETAEFSTGVKRIINKEVCHGCFNDPDVKFDRGDWNWCPRLKGTSRQFECTRNITSVMVINAIKETILERDNQ